MRRSDTAPPLSRAHVGPTLTTALTSAAKTASATFLAIARGPQWYVWVCVSLIAGLFALKIAAVFGAFLPPDVHSYQGLHSFSDFLSLIGARNFTKYGYLKNYLLMNDAVGPAYSARGWQFYQVPQTSLNAARFYTHYGADDARLVSLLYFVGIKDLTGLYVVFSCIAFSSLWLWYKGAARLFNRFIAITSAVLIAFDFHFFSVAESGTAESLAFIIFFMFIYGLGRYLVRRRSNDALVGGVVLWLACVLQATNNPEFVPMMGLLAFAVPLCLEGTKYRFLPCSLLAATGLATGFAVHFGLAIWALGGWNNFGTDMIAAFARRTHGFSLATEVGYKDFQLARAPSYLNVEFYWASRVSLVYLLVLICALAIFTWMAARAKGGLINATLVEQKMRLLAAFALAAIPFPIIFVQAAVTQPLDILKIFSPVLALALAVGTYVTLLLLGRIHTALRSGTPVAQWAFCVALIGGLLIHYAVAKADEVHGLGRRGLIGMSRTYSGGDIVTLQQLGKFLRGHTRYGDIIFAAANTGDTGHPDYPFPAWEYYSNRRIEVDDRVERWLNIMEQIQRRKASAGASERTAFYVLADTRYIIPPLSEFLRSYGTHISSITVGQEEIASAVSIPTAPPQFELFRLSAPVSEMRGFKSTDLQLPADLNSSDPSLPLSWATLPMKDLGAWGAGNSVDIEKMRPGFGTGGTIVADGSQLPSFFDRENYGSIILRPDTVDNASISINNSISATQGYVVDAVTRAFRPEPLPENLSEFARVAFKDEAIFSIFDGWHEIKMYLFQNGLVITNGNGKPISLISYKTFVTNYESNPPIRVRVIVYRDRGVLVLDGKPLLLRLATGGSKRHGIIVGNFGPRDDGRFDDRPLAQVELLSLSWANLDPRWANALAAQDVPPIDRQVAWSALLSRGRMTIYSPDTVRECWASISSDTRDGAYGTEIEKSENPQFCLRAAPEVAAGGPPLQIGMIALSGIFRACLGQYPGSGFGLVVADDKSLISIEFDYRRITVARGDTILSTIPYSPGFATEMQIEPLNKFMLIKVNSEPDVLISLGEEMHPNMVFLRMPWEERVSCVPAYIRDFGVQMEEYDNDRSPWRNTFILRDEVH